MRKLITAFLILALMLSLSFTLISCGEGGEGNENNGTAGVPDVPRYKEEEVKILLLVYNEAQAQGFEGSLEEFLALVKGKDGKSPEVKINEEGYWVIDGVVSDVKATGIQGEKGDKGDTGAEEPQGNPGQNGADGEDGVTPVFKIENGELQVSYDNSETWTSLGNVKGEDGEDSSNGTNGSNGDKGETGATIEKVEFDEEGRLRWLHLCRAYF